MLSIFPATSMSSCFTSVTGKSSGAAEGAEKFLKFGEVKIYKMLDALSFFLQRPIFHVSNSVTKKRSGAYETMEKNFDMIVSKNSKKWIKKYKYQQTMYYQHVGCFAHVSRNICFFMFPVLFQENAMTSNREWGKDLGGFYLFRYQKNDLLHRMLDALNIFLQHSILHLSSCITGKNSGAEDGVDKYFGGILYGIKKICLLDNTNMYYQLVGCSAHFSWNVHLFTFLILFHEKLEVPMRLWK